LADIQSIISGKTVYDPVSKQTVRRAEFKEYERQEPPRESDAENGRGAPDNGQGIFDRIAKSMQYAGAYDLGSVELENRFADFDRMEDLKDAARRKPKRAALAEKRQPATEQPKVEHADFIEDLDAIKKEASCAAENSPQEISAAQSLPEYSAPFYGTGEHVKAGGALYVDQLLVGKGAGVSFSYGEIIAMADLFDTVDEMMDEQPAVLQSVRDCIRRSERGESISDETWETATNGRYLRLAEDNNEHFAPDPLFPGRFLRLAQHRNHKAAWEAHHKRAVEEAQRMALEPANAKTSYLPMWPLIINAFGDHFLTDAFAAGHVINKEEVIAYFKSKFYDGSSLTNEAKSFFRNLATKAWHGSVAAKFQKLETYEPHDAWWNFVHWHPDIKDAERFGDVLIGAAQKEPDKVANLVVLVIHDVLNDNGIDVANEAGNTWRLTGDGHLTQPSLQIMKAAVERSAGNITDPSILSSNVSFESLFATVWRHVPQLTPASRSAVQALIAGYVTPSSTSLVQRAAAIIHGKIDMLIRRLKKNKALRDI
jgi:hypothetical protein